MEDLPGPGLEPMSPALAGGFLTAAPPRKSLHEGLIREEQRREEVWGRGGGGAGGQLTFIKPILGVRESLRRRKASSPKREKVLKAGER